jgi:hypothetical protein
MGLLDDIENSVSNIAKVLPTPISPLEVLREAKNNETAKNEERKVLSSTPAHWILSIPKTITEVADGYLFNYNRKKPSFYNNDK